MKHLLLLQAFMLLLILNSCRENIDKKEVNETLIQENPITRKLENSACKVTFDTMGNTNAPVELIGLYENIVNTNDHTYGYSLKLWKLEEQILGFFNVYESSLEPDRSGVITSGSLATNDSLYIEAWTKESKGFKDWQQSDVHIFSFSGKLNANKLIGKLSMLNCSNNTIEYVQQLELNYSEMWPLESYANIEDWKENYANNLDMAN
ncbi:hypothetical protein [uncultured Maribacter sp.]|uniref:hypothetical protein n=1 Tax=uncultured Maribacter sp. TaxID=431308 RepID=UPI00261BF8A8|nr:hypothetical protein [uncultured Maribacter sp.]